LKIISFYSQLERKKEERMRLPQKNPYQKSDTIDTIVFDFDGTLADTLPSSLMSFRSTLQHFDINLPTPITLSTYGHQSVAGMFQQAGVSDKNKLLSLIDQYNSMYREIAPVNASLFPGVRHTLNILRNYSYRLAIATNESRQNLDILLDAFNIRHFFTATCCADEVKQPKPWPDMGRKVVSKIGTAAIRSLMIGDSVCDIEMARNNRMNSCAVSWGATNFDRLLESSPNWAITDTTQLLEILNIAYTAPFFYRIYVDKRAGISETSLTC
jgi:phosphoglycolate phosphatase-like HAD superfamily hydrolase